MNKKRWMILVSLLLGGLMIFGATMASASINTGYDVYKTALKNTHTATSITTSGEASISDNGTSLGKINGTAKINIKGQTASGTITSNIGSETRTTDFYQQDGQMITKDSASEVYQVMKDHHGARLNSQDTEEFKADQKYAQDIENIVDTVVGNLKTFVVLDTQADGSKKVSLQLSGNQIPPVANAVAALMTKAAAQHDIGHQQGESPLGVNPLANFPKLVDGISISSVNIEALVNDKDVITSQQAQITINGKDAAGNAHTVLINVNLNFTDINQTNPETVDLTGKQVNNVQRDEMKRFKD